MWVYKYKTFTVILEEFKKVMVTSKYRQPAGTVTWSSLRNGHFMSGQLVIAGQSKCQINKLIRSLLLIVINTLYWLR